MLRMEKLTTGIAYGASATNAGYWNLQLLDRCHHHSGQPNGVLSGGVRAADVSDKPVFQNQRDRRKAAGENSG